MQTVLVYVLVPLLSCVLISLLAAGRRRSRRPRPRYRPGEAWPHAPVWWSANPDGVRLPDSAEPADSVLGSRGGARWWLVS